MAYKEINWFGSGTKEDGNERHEIVKTSAKAIGACIGLAAVGVCLGVVGKAFGGSNGSSGGGSS